MAEIIKTGEDAIGDAVTDLAHEAGATAAHVEHHAEALEEHAEQIADVQKDAEWTKERIDSLAEQVSNLTSTAASIPTETIAEIRSDLDRVISTVSSLVSDGERTAAESGSATSAPPATENKAEADRPKGPFAGVRAFLHRLL